MAACKIVNQSVLDAIDAIKSISNSYRTLGEEFIKSFNNAIAEMEGETKDALKNFIDTDVNKFVAEDLPDAVYGMSELLEANRANFESLDSQLAANISGN